MANADMCLEAARKAFPNNEELRVAYMIGFDEGFDRAMEQPEVDLEEEIKRFLSNATKMNKGEWRGKYPISDIGFRAVARHFYELGLNARKEE